MIKKTKVFKERADKNCRGKMCRVDGAIKNYGKYAVKSVCFFDREAVLMGINRLGSAMGIYRKMENSYKSGIKGEKKTDAASSRRVDTFEMSANARAGFEPVRNAAKSVRDSGASAERIASLKSRIADGSYNISPESVAASIFEG